MTDEEYEDLDAALDRVVTAAKAHLAAVRAAGRRVDDDAVWQAYVDLNNASFDYDQALLDQFGEVTPWDVQSIDPDEADQRFGLGVGGIDGAEADDPYQKVISVRQRRDYRVPSVAALLRAAEAARRNSVPADEDPGLVESVGEAVLELLQAGDGSLSSLDVPELDPLDGLLTVTEVGAPLDLEAYDDADGTGPFIQADTDQLVGRLDEHPYIPDEDEESHQH